MMKRGVREGRIRSIVGILMDPGRKNRGRPTIFLLPSPVQGKAKKGGPTKLIYNENLKKKGYVGKRKGGRV